VDLQDENAVGVKLGRMYQVTKRDVHKIDALDHGKQSKHIFRLPFKHGVSPCSATLHECQTNQMPSRS